MPTRRGLLALGGTGLAASLSGCLSSGLLAGRPAVREQSGQTVERSIYTPLSDESAKPAFATLLVGDGGGFHLGEKRPHQVWVRNDTGESRDVTVELADDTDADPWFSRRYDFERGARLVAELRSPRRYAVTIRAGDRAETVAVPKSRFDCNASATDVVVRESEMETFGITTDEGCGGLR